MNAMKTYKRVQRETEEAALEERFKKEKEMLANLTEDQRKDYLAEKERKHKKLLDLCSIPFCVSNYYGR